MNKHLLTLAALLGCLTLQAETIPVRQWRMTSSSSISAPVLLDSVDVNGNAWDHSSAQMDAILPLAAWKQGTLTTDSILSATETDAVRLAGFTIQNSSFAKVNIQLKSKSRADIYVDGQRGGQQDLVPGRHEVVVRLLQKAGQADTLSASVESEQTLAINPEGKGPYTLSTLMNGERMSGISISPDGRFLVLDKSITRPDTKVDRTKYLIDLQTGLRRTISGFYQWTSKGHSYITTYTAADLAVVYQAVDAVTGQATTLCTDYSGQYGQFLPGEKQMLVSKSVEGPKEDPQVFQTLTPDDRQPGWRNRNNIGLLDVQTGQLRMLTAGQRNVNAQPSPDGTKMLLTVYFDDVTQRPFNFTRSLVLDMESMQVDTIYNKDGFVTGAQWTKDSRSIIYLASAEAFGGIGNHLPQGVIPSMIDADLFRYDLATRTFTPLTDHFNPSITSDWRVSKYDGMIYAVCENQDNQDIFCIDPQTGKAKQLPLSERFVLHFALADEKPILTYYGQGHSNSDRLYTYNTKTGKETLVEDLDAVRMADIELGEFGEWNFQSQRGDTICGRYYLPPHFDPAKKYPMLVYYYGGCSPVGRYLDSYYSFHGWATMGYVVYVVQPSGCSGFGPEFASRHVNTYGDYTANDIIEGTKKFCDEHPFVNRDKIGCLGASYGGFMTQYLQTQTDIFAAAMSHAGISDPTSYWGYGYWGYSYSAVSAANSYPWNNKQLFTDHAPLTLADRIHTPILFMHGGADTNVPINESVQMFTALQILGRPCAFVTVEGQNHHILDYGKRIKWQNTIYAWFEKWLKDDPTWWNTMYPEKNL